jgi:hypothetical protein
VGRLGARETPPGVQRRSVLLEELRHLGPEVQPNQVLLTIDEVLTRKPAVGHFLLCARRGS